MADAPMEGSKASQEHITDPRFEFDAPRYYDFARGSPDSEGRPDDWFGDPKATAGLKSPPDQEKDETNENAPPAPASVNKGAAKSLNIKLAAADPTQAGRCRQVLAPIENSVPQGSSVGISASEEAYQGEEDHDAEPIASQRSDHGKQRVVVPAANSIEQDQNYGQDEAVDGSSEAEPKQLSATDALLATKRAVGRVTGKATRDVVQQQEQHFPEHNEAGSKEHQASSQVKKKALDTRKANRPATKSRLHAMRTRSLAKEPAPLEEGASPWRSRAERIAEFEGRLMTRPKGGFATHGLHPAAAEIAAPTASGSANVPGPLTLPHSPALQTRKRARPPRFKPREEVEAEEMAALPPFKARPFRKSMFSEEARHKGVPPAPNRPTTTQQPFDLVTDQRANARTARG